MKLRKLIVLFLLPFALTSFKNKEKLVDYPNNGEACVIVEINNV